jgi:protein involved in polysaccharide export with SLBB domain
LSEEGRFAVHRLMTKMNFAVSPCVLRAMGGILLAGLIASGCATDRSGHFADLPEADGYNQDTLRAGDLLNVAFFQPGQTSAPLEVKISDEGEIILIHNQTFEADGKTCAELGREIHDRLVPRFYVEITVNVRNMGQFFYVDGEVKTPSRQAWVVPITVSQAIASCGGFTEFAKKTNVELIRVTGRKQTVNCKKVLATPRLDLKVYPGDKVYVHRKRI